MAHIVSNLRDVDRRELMATAAEQTEQWLLEHALTWRGVCWTLKLNQEPVGAGGINMVEPAVGQCWLFGTDKLPALRVAMTRQGRLAVKWALKTDVCRVLRAYSAAFHTEAHAWLQAIGFRLYEPLPNFGRGGEDFILFSIDKR